MHILVNLFHTSRISIALFSMLLTSFYFEAMDAPIDRLYLLVTGTSVLLVYRYAASTLTQIHSQGFRSGWASRPWVFISALLWLAFMATYQSISILFLALLATWMTTAYFIKILPFGEALTKHNFLKPLVTGWVFSLLTTAIPLLISKQYLWHEIAKITAGNVFFITGLCVLFDLFERFTSATETDVSAIRIYKRFANGLIVSAGIFHAWAAYTFIISISAFVALAMTYGITLVIIKFASSNRNTTLYQLMADSMMALPWVVWQLLQ
jgi:hypothetical protein